MLHAQCVQARSGPLRLTMVALERELLHQAKHARNSQIQANIYAQARGLGDHHYRFSHMFFFRNWRKRWQGCANTRCWRR